MTRHSVVLGSASGADVVVYIQQAPGTFTPPAKPIEMDQGRMRFAPIHRRRVAPETEGAGKAGDRHGRKAGHRGFHAQPLSGGIS